MNVRVTSKIWPAQGLWKLEQHFFCFGFMTEVVSFEFELAHLIRAAKNPFLFLVGVHFYHANIKFVRDFEFF